jgi:prepilin-type N-terminal cleavage/methylation domain-containing protein
MRVRRCCFRPGKSGGKVALAGPRRQPHRGFTLLESALAIVIIGSGLAAMLQLLAAGTVSNEAATDLTIAVNLANNLHEITIRLPLVDPNYPGTWNPHLSSPKSFAGVSEFDGSTFSPPIDVSCQPIAGYSNWSQVVTVQSVSDRNLNTVIANSTIEWTARVTVQVLCGGRVIYQTSWLATEPPS